jgi:hypothetical protein
VPIGVGVLSNVLTGTLSIGDSAMDIIKDVAKAGQSVTDFLLFDQTDFDGSKSQSKSQSGSGAVVDGNGNLQGGAKLVPGGRYLINNIPFLLVKEKTIQSRNRPKRQKRTQNMGSIKRDIDELKRLVMMSDK